MTIDWEAAGAVATAFAALVALLPIFIASAARKAKARNLRMRVVVKLTKLRPTLGAIVVPSSLHDVPDHAILSNKDLIKTVAELESMLKETEALTPKEQDSLSQVIANLELMLPSVCSKQLPAAGAKAVLQLIDRTVEILEKQGLMKNQPYQPWKDRIDA